MDNTLRTPSQDNTTGTTSSDHHETGDSSSTPSSAPSSAPATQAPFAAESPLWSSESPSPTRFRRTLAGQRVNRALAQAPRSHRGRGLEDELDADEWDFIQGDTAEALNARAGLELTRRQAREEGLRRIGREQYRQRFAPVAGLIGRSPDASPLNPRTPVHNHSLGGSFRVAGSTDRPRQSRSPIISPGSCFTTSDTYNSVSGKNDPFQFKSNTQTKTTAARDVRKLRGARAILDDSVDRVPAHVGDENEAKLTISFRTEMPDPNNIQEWIPGPVAVRHYRHHLERSQRIEWNNRRSVMKLNAWREQIFRRNFGEVRKTRSYWIESEKSEVLRMAAEQLQGRNALDYGALANRYNTQNPLSGVEQRRGEVRVAEGRNHIPASIKEDRIAPWRTGSAMRGQTTKWPEFAKLIADSKARKLQRSLEGTLLRDPAEAQEIPDPNPYVSPEKRDYTPSKRKKLGRGMGQETPVKKLKQPDARELDEDVGFDVDQEMMDINAAVMESLKRARGNKSGQVKIYTTGSLWAHTADAHETTAQQATNAVMDEVVTGIATVPEDPGPNLGFEDISRENNDTIDVEEGQVEDDDIEEGEIIED